MGKVNVSISWTENNYCAFAQGTEINGCVIVTGKTFEGIKKDFLEALQFHIEGLIKEGDSIPEWVKLGNCELIFTYEVSALLHRLDGVLTRSALSRATGINERQIGHYASGHRKPRPAQREKIINGIHSISKDLASVV
ncbi:type II toxin-antitoxin system HicB family antitoxin [Viscerimonas tarda]